MKDPILALEILDWILGQQLMGLDPNSLAIAENFEITVGESERVIRELVAVGELEVGWLTKSTGLMAPTAGCQIFGQ